MDKINSNRKIIPFPNLDERLLDRGRECLEEGNYKDAIQYLEEANKINQENEEVWYALMAAYLQTNQISLAKKLIESMMRLGIGDYFQTAEMYITILIQLHEYESALQFIQVLFEEHQVPFHKEEQYENLLNLCKGMLKNDNEQDESRERIDLEKILNSNVTTVIQEMENIDFDELLNQIDVIKKFLVDNGKNPFIKTVLLNILKENQYGQGLLIKKYGKDIYIHLNEYQSVRDTPFSKAVKEGIIKKYQHEDPSFTEYAITLANRFFFYVYPLEKEFTNPNAWIEAIGLCVKHYLTENESIDHIVLDDEVRSAFSFILQVDKSLNI